LRARRGFVCAGKVGTGFSETTRKELLEQLTPLAVAESPFTKRLSPAETRLAHFVRPGVVGEVQYDEWTSDGQLRHLYGAGCGLTGTRARSSVSR
jgi:bifunctional non-homologous end joining protein LigD